MSNILPPQEIKKIKGLYKKRLVVVSLRALTVLSLVAAACIVPSYIYSKQEEGVLLAKKAVFEQKETGELKQDLVNSIADINTRLSSFNDTTYNSPLIAGFINPILQARTSSVYITGLTYTLDKDANVAHVTISGLSINREAILTFGSNLQKTPRITNVNVPITNFIKESNMPFTISLDAQLQ